MKPLVIEIVREYAEDDAKKVKTITVGELREILYEFDEYRPVYVHLSGAKVNGSISYLSFADAD